MRCRPLTDRAQMCSHPPRVSTLAVDYAGHGNGRRERAVSIGECGGLWLDFTRRFVLSSSPCRCRCARGPHNLPEKRRKAVRALSVSSGEADPVVDNSAWLEASVSKSSTVASSSSFYISIRSTADPPQCVHSFKTRCLDPDDNNVATLWCPLSPTRTTSNIECAILETELQLSSFNLRTWSVITYLRSFFLQG